MGTGSQRRMRSNSSRGGVDDFFCRSFALGQPDEMRVARRSVADQIALLVPLDFEWRQNGGKR